MGKEQLSEKSFAVTFKPKGCLSNGTEYVTDIVNAVDLEGAMEYVRNTYGGFVIDAAEVQLSETTSEDHLMDAAAHLADAKMAKKKSDSKKYHDSMMLHHNSMSKHHKDDPMLKMHHKKESDKHFNHYSYIEANESEQLDELSPLTLGAYRKKAEKEIAGHEKEAEKAWKEKRYADDQLHTDLAAKRALGAARARSRLKRMSESETVHRIGVHVSHDGLPVHKRKEGESRFMKIRGAKDHHEAIERAKKAYRKAGMKVHDAWDATIKKESIDESAMSPAQKSKREEIVMSMKNDQVGLKDRYGSKWKDVMYATATTLAMDEHAFEFDMNDVIVEGTAGYHPMSGHPYILRVPGKLFDLQLGEDGETYYPTYYNMRVKYGWDLDGVSTESEEVDGAVLVESKEGYDYPEGSRVRIKKAYGGKIGTVTGHSPSGSHVMVKHGKATAYYHFSDIETKPKKKIAENANDDEFEMIKKLERRYIRRRRSKERAAQIENQ